MWLNSLKYPPYTELSTNAELEKKKRNVTYALTNFNRNEFIAIWIDEEQ